MYLKLKACESCASPFTYLGKVYIKKSLGFISTIGEEREKEKEIHLLPLFFGSRPPAHFYRFRLPVWGILNLNPIFGVVVVTICMYTW